MMQTETKFKCRFLFIGALLVSISCSQILLTFFYKIKQNQITHHSHLTADARTDAATAIAIAKSEFTQDIISLAPAEFNSSIPPSRIHTPLALSDGRTLLIVQGSWRSLDRTVESIVKNLVLPNAPCDVVLSLDAPGPEATFPVLSTLQPFLLAVVYPQVSDATDQGMEFSQTLRALRVVNTSAYSFVMKSRTDLMVVQRFAFKVGVGIGAEFAASFAAFLDAVRIKYPHATPCGVLEAWVRSNGMVHYADFAHPLDTGASTRPMPWSPVSSYDMTPSLAKAVQSACTSSWGGDASSASRDRGWRFLESRPEALSKAVLEIASRSRIFYGQGSTWISWGERSEFIALHSVMKNAHRSLDWAQLPHPGEEWALRQGFCNGNCAEMNRATEATFRMAHIVRGLSFAELFAPADFAVSFINSAMLHCADGLAGILGGALNSSILPAAFVLRRKHAGCANAAGLAGRSNPFCGSEAESQNHATLTLFCETGVIDELPLALYGTPSGSSCLEFVADPSCNDAAYHAYAQATCLGFPYCVLKPRERVDPCPGLYPQFCNVYHVCAISVSPIFFLSPFLPFIPMSK